MLHMFIITEAVLETLIAILIIVFIAVVSVFIGERLGEYYQNWKTIRRNRRDDKEWEEYLQQKRKRKIERELHEIEKRKYPLFYWRETCAKRTLNEGIV